MNHVPAERVLAWAASAVADDATVVAATGHGRSLEPYEKDERRDAFLRSALDRLAGADDVR